MSWMTRYSHRRLWLQAIGLGLIIFSATWYFQPNIGICDLDAFAYSTGALSLSRGEGYRDFDHAKIRHWPPGYSLLLSVFPNPVFAGQVINYLMLSVVAVMLWLLARFYGWSEWGSLAVAIALSCGFFRGLATQLKPDILNYAFFFAGAFVFFRHPKMRVWVYLAWGLLIVFKWIALVFIPAGVVTEAWHKKKIEWPWRRFLIATAVWFACLGSVVAFNWLWIGKGYPFDQSFSPFRWLLAGWYSLTFSFFRTFIAYWYGSLSISPWLICFGITLALGIASLVTLRFDQRGSDARKAALSLIVLTSFLLLVQPHSGDARLFGYGLVLLILASAPRPVHQRIWMIYALSVCLLFVANTLSVDSSGANHPDYRRLAGELESVPTGSLNFQTNSFHIIDVHSSKIRSEPGEISQTSPDRFLWVFLPSHDAITRLVWPVEHPGRGWCPSAKLHGAVLFERCPEGVPLSGIPEVVSRDRSPHQ